MSDAAALFPFDEFKFMTDFFDSAVDVLNDQSCNDFTTTYSPEKEEVILAVAAFNARGDGESDPEELRRQCRLDDKTLFMFDSAVADYFSTRFADVNLASISVAEAQIGADLLDQIAAMHEEWARGGEDESDSMDLAATTANKTFMLAALHFSGGKSKALAKRIESATDAISIPNYIAMRYLAHRCRTLATGGTLRIDRVAGNAPVGKDGIPDIVSPGIAPRFPDVKKYAKMSWCFIPNWQDEDLECLARYAERGADSGISPVNARTSLWHSTLALRQIAVQVALGAPLEKPIVSKGVQACIKRVAELQVRAPHVYSMVDIGEARDVKIASFLLVEEAYSPEEIEQGILAFHVMTEASDGQRAHAHKIARMVADSEQIQGFLKKKILAREGLLKYRGEIGSNWHIPWQRSVAYQYWAFAMAQQMPLSHGSGPEHSVPTAVHCILLGWHNEARRLLQNIHEQFATLGIVIMGHKSTKQRRTQFFALCLADLWQGGVVKTLPLKVPGDPIFDALLAHWRHPDPAAIAPLLLAACDRHTQSAAAKEQVAEIESREYWYDPFEIHMLLYLRREHGLENPVLDHPIMNTPLGKLPEVAPPYSEPLLDGVKARSRAEFPALAEW